jgi:NAD(P)-dependent dehydrogenase (short-subunit alcohol dehydrogenase family)
MPASTAPGSASCSTPTISRGRRTSCASKAGLSSYLGGLALALRPRGVQVTNVRFGFVDTKMAKYHVRPFMITAERAAGVVVRCLRRRPAQVTYPRRMGALVWLLDRLTSLRLWLTRA